jgi:hypothetical protein
MLKKLLFSASFMCSAMLASAQYDLTLTYTANQGSTTLQGAAKVYIHSGGNDQAGPLDATSWFYTVGSLNQDDGIGEMFSLGPDIWTITFDPVQYYSQATNGPVQGTSIQRIGMYFRDANGTNFGKDANGEDIYLDLSTGSPAAYNTDGSMFFGVTAGIAAGVNSPQSSAMVVRNAPNPMTTSTVFEYTVAGDQNVNLSIYDATGRLVKTIFNELQTSGKHYYNWIGDDANGNSLGGGVYFYTLNSGAESVKGKLIIVR